jgi:HEAT repeat protein
LAIRASTSKEVETLVADLSSDSSLKRDAAVARLTVIGARAVDRVTRLASNRSSSATARIAAFRSLEAIADPRALPATLEAFTDPDASIAVAALNTARVFLRMPQGVDALDGVIQIALDREGVLPVRLAAIQALSELPPATVEPILAALRSEPEPEIANVLKPARRRAVVNTVQRLEAAAAGNLPTDAEALKSAIARSGAEVPLPTLHQIVERVRVREGSDAAERRSGWMGARAAAHVALADRGSRLALYDLRETIGSLREPIPVEFFAAVTAIGDATCLEPIAAAYRRTKDDWSRMHLAEAFRAIVGREKITRRHAIVQKIEKRWPGIWKSLVVSG